MARSELKTLWALLALAAGACDGRQTQAAQSSITVKLPPRRPHPPAPAFRGVANNRDPLQSP